MQPASRRLTSCPAAPPCQRRLIAVLAMLCAGSSLRTARAAPFTPGGQGARSYFAPVPANAGAEALTDSLQRALFHKVEQSARQKGQPAPVADPRLCAVAEALSQVIGPDDVPSLEMQEFLLSHYGLGEPPPQLAFLSVVLDDDELRDKIAGSFPAILAGGPFARVGIGVTRRFWGRTSVVLAFQRVQIELLPVPRHLPAGGSALLGGRLLEGLRAPSVLVAPPRGPVHDLIVRGAADGFQTIFRCDDGGDGRYQIEIVGRAISGKTVVANFPIFCAVDPPRVGPANPAARPESLDPRRAEQIMLEAVNRDRAQAGLGQVRWDEPLANVARSYSDEMASHHRVVHDSPQSGNAADRVRNAGVRALIVLENVARANSVADAERSFLTSPGHRANVLDREATRLGVGITIQREGGGAPSLYVTQLYSR